MPIQGSDFLPDWYENLAGYTRYGMQELGVSPTSRLGRFAGGVAEDLQPAVEPAVKAARLG